MNARICAPMLLCVVLLGPKTCAEEPNIDLDAERELLKDKIFQGSYWSGAAVRYQAEMAGRYASELNTWNRLATGVSIFAFIASLVLGNIRQRWLSVAMTIVGFVGFYFSMQSGDPAASDRYIDHVVLEKRWENMKSEWNELEVEWRRMPQDELVASVHALMEQQNAIESAEPPDYDEEAWDDAWVKEAQVRELRVPPKPDAFEQASATL